MDRHRLFAAAVLMLTVLVTVPVEVGADGQFCIVGIQPTFDPILGNGYIITWNAAQGRTNYLTYADSPNGAWQDLVGILPTGAAAMGAIDYPPVSATQRFYRVRAQRSSLVMTLVLDRSGSMLSNGGSTALPAAVTDFIQNFDDTNDIAAMISFASAASVDVAMGQPFRTKIEDATYNLVFNGYTCSDQGLTNALAQNNTVTNSLGQNVVKVIVFFTDGMANTFYDIFNCGPRNIAYSGPQLYDPATGNPANTGCTVPDPITSIDGVNCLLTTSRQPTKAVAYRCMKRRKNARKQLRTLRARKTTPSIASGWGVRVFSGSALGHFPY